MAVSMLQEQRLLEVSRAMGEKLKHVWVVPHFEIGLRPCYRPYRSMHRRMGTLWLGGAEGLICPKFYTDNHRHPPPLDIARVTSSTLPKFEKHPYSWTFTSTPLGHCLCDVIINIPKGLICSFLWPIFSSCFARISPTVCPNFTHCLPEFGGAAAPPAPPPASYAYGSMNTSLADSLCVTIKIF